MTLKEVMSGYKHSEKEEDLIISINKHVKRGNEDMKDAVDYANEAEQFGPSETTNRIHYLISSRDRYKMALRNLEDIQRLVDVLFPITDDRKLRRDLSVLAADARREAESIKPNAEKRTEVSAPSYL